MVAESISKNKGAAVRCALIDKTDHDLGSELRFSVPTLTGYQVIDCLDYSSKNDGSKALWHTFQHAQQTNNKGLFIRFLQYSDVCLHVEENYHYQFPQQVQAQACPKFHNLLETNLWGTVKSGYFFRRHNIIRFYEPTSDASRVHECGAGFVVLIFNKNVFFVPYKLWSTFFYAAFKDAKFGEECYDTRLLSRNRKTSFKIRFRKDSPVVLEAEIVHETTVAQQKIKDGKPFCIIRGRSFEKLKLPIYSITGRQNDCFNDYNMHRRIWARGYVKAKKKSLIRSFSFYYLDMFDDDESKEIIFEPNSISETIGRSITMLIIPQTCEVR